MKRVKFEKKYVSRLSVAVLICSILTATVYAAFSWQSDADNVHFYLLTASPRFRVERIEVLGNFNRDYLEGLTSSGVNEWNTPTTLSSVFISGPGTTGADVYIRAGRPNYLYANYAYDTSRNR